MDRTYTLQDLLAALKRRRVLAALVAAAILLAAGAAILTLPNEYLAQSVVQIEPHHLTPEFFPGQNYASFEDRMRTLKHGILARPVLERVIRETKLYGDRDMDDAVEELRRHVEVRLEGEVAGGPPSLLFVVEVRGRDPQKVAQAAQLLPEAYAEMTRGVLAQQASSVRTTLDGQMKSLQRDLSDHEKRLLDFKVAHAAELPESIETNMRTAGRLETQIEMRLASIADAQRRRTLVLASVPEAESEAGRAVGGLDDVERRLQAARAAYGPAHPDVKRIEREWQEAVARRSAEVKAFQEKRVQPHLSLIDGEVQGDRAALATLEKALAEVQTRIDAAPRWGEELRGMSRDYEALKARYNTVLARDADARAAETLLAADASNLFHTLQPAVAPRRPVAPNRFNLAWVALAAALAAALLAAALAEYLDTSLRGPEDAVAFGVPVLAAIPRIGPRRSGAR